MGQLVLQIAGTLIGSAFGPVGARIGGIIGALIGNALFGEDTVTEGPRLSDLTTSSSAFGTPITWVFGTQRVGTQMIWATDIIEVRTETSSGGKGGPSQTQVTFSYFANAAFLCCRGTKVIMKIWGDGKLLRDITGSQGQLESSKFAGLFKTYTGNETQQPDPTIQDDIGVDDTPAYRGTCYFVITDFPLEDFGNRIPQMTALVTDSTPSFPSASLDLEQARLDGLLIGTIGSGGVSNSQFTADGRYFSCYSAALVIDTFTQKVVLNIANNPVAFYSDPRLDSNGNHVGYTRLSTAWVVVMDPQTLLPLYGASLPNNHFALNHAISPGASGIAGQAIVDRVTVFGLFGNVAVYDTVPVDLLTNFTNVDGNEVPTLAEHYVLNLANFALPSTQATGWDKPGGAVVDRDGIVWVAYEDNQSADQKDLFLVEFDPWAGAFLSIVQVPNADLILNGFDNPGPMAYDPATHKLAIVTTNIAGTDHIQQYDIATRTFKEPALVGAVHTDAGVHWNGAWAINGGIWTRFSNNFSQILFYDFATHTMTRELSLSGDWGILTTAGLAYDRLQNALIVIDEIVPPEYFWAFIDREGINPTDLQTIVNEISAEVGLDAADLDTDALAATVVKGYAINNRMPARNALEPLRGSFFFDAAESDYQMKFVLRGGNPVITLTDDDLGASNNLEATTPLVAETRLQEVELPARIDFQYSDENFEYQQGSQYAKRADEAVITIEQQRMDVAIVMNATEAKNIAEVRLYLPWIEREKKSFVLTEQQLALDPTDVVQITLDDGTSFEVYLFDIDTSVDGLLEIQAVLQRPETQTFRSTTVGQEAEGFDPDLMSVASGSTFFVMDTPLLLDNDESTVPVLYTAAGPLGSGASGQLLEWNGARLDRSFDAAIFTPWTFHPSATAVDHGIVKTALPAVTAPWVWDRVNVINVSMQNGVLSSLSEAQVLDGGNAALLGKEIIQFATAVLISDGSYNISTLLRARRGTDQYARVNNGIAHGSNERFIILTIPTIQVKAHTVDNLNRLATYRALTVGATGISTKQLTPVGQSKYPYAPYLVAGTRDGAGEVVLTWSRRTRLGGAIDWQQGPSEPPLGEDAENYQVSVLDVNGLEVRSIAVTAETATYTVAEQLSDFGTDLDPVEDTLDFIIYQVSGTIGRGFPSETLNV